MVDPGIKRRAGRQAGAVVMALLWPTLLPQTASAFDLMSFEFGSSSPFGMPGYQPGVVGRAVDTLPHLHPEGTPTFGAWSSTRWTHAVQRDASVASDAIQETIGADARVTDDVRLGVGVAANTVGYSTLRSGGAIEKANEYDALGFAYGSCLLNDSVAVYGYLGHEEGVFSDRVAFRGEMVEGHVDTRDWYGALGLVGGIRRGPVSLTGSLQYEMDYITWSEPYRGGRNVTFPASEYGNGFNSIAANVRVDYQLPYVTPYFRIGAGGTSADGVGASGGEAGAGLLWKAAHGFSMSAEGFRGQTGGNNRPTAGAQIDLHLQF